MLLDSGGRRHRSAHNWRWVLVKSGLGATFREINLTTRADLGLPFTRSFFPRTTVRIRHTLRLVFQEPVPISLSRHSLQPYACLNCHCLCTHFCSRITPYYSPTLPFSPLLGWLTTMAYVASWASEAECFLFVLF